MSGNDDANDVRPAILVVTVEKIPVVSLLSLYDNAVEFVDMVTVDSDCG